MVSTRSTNRGGSRRVYAEVASDNGEGSQDEVLPQIRPERSEKPKRKRQKSAAVGEFVGGDEETDDAAESVPKAKSTRKGTKKAAAAAGNKNAELKRRNARSKKGLLQEVVNFPLDILYEVCTSFATCSITLFLIIPQIFAHLSPEDILALSRTSKDFRALLMRKSATPIWKVARENVPNLPPCPLDLHEPQYANLLFETSCHVSRRLQHLYLDFSD